MGQRTTGVKGKSVPGQPAGPQGRSGHVVADVPEATCARCGCTDSRACEGGCYWISVDRSKGTGICSNCAPVTGNPPRSPTTPILNLWNIYRQILPRDASLNQIKETRRAFYGGCVAMFQLVVQVSVQDEDRATAIMTTIDNEVQAWVSDIGSGDDQN